ncbi:fatty acid desaturase [Sulfitobacter sp. TSTF-M16]|uniref:Fatty acid desaturase n=1 Tax=Sulfitobacter aestuariivivens TaxID=2766981 RepID=A0A927CZY8_9RHOB|nr:fatty acid desaturase [Sulfitobacter aestuariivivens]
MGQTIIGRIAHWDWPTLWLFAGAVLVLGIALLLPEGWGALGFVLLVLGLVLHSSLSHEILHGHPFASERAGTLLGLVQPGLAIPYLRFKRLHLDHHMDARLTDPYDDPESNYLDPAVWAGLSRFSKITLQFNNTLLGRMLIGPLIAQWAFMRGDLARILKGDRQVLWDWVLHMPGAVLVVWLVTLSAVPLWLYLLACYVALSVLKIRTFLEHQAHEHCAGRTVIIEDRGLLALLFLNNNLHVVHHMHPTVAWYRLPDLYRSQKQRFQARNDGYVYQSYSQIFRRFFLRRKDPVAHPLWRGPSE